MKSFKQTIFLSIGGSIIKIRFGEYKNSYFYSLFMKQLRYIFNKYIILEPSYSVTITIDVVEDPCLNLIEKDKKILLKVAHISNKKIVTFYHLGIRQFCRIVAQFVFKNIIMNRGLYLHGSAVQTNHGVAIFLGESGAGKSTISSLLSPTYPLLADDQLFIIYKNNRYYFYQTFIPESNPHILSHTKIIPLWKIFFIEKSRKLSVRHISSKTEVYKRISPQLFTTVSYVARSNKNLVNFIKIKDLFFTYTFPKDKTSLISSFQELTK